MTFVQMEALTGWAAKDEWDFEYLGMTNNPFIKANYPHHGKWYRHSCYILCSGSNCSDLLILPTVIPLS